jgi:hypothetical protein
VYSPQVDDVLEIPTDEDIDPSHGGKGEVQGIRAHTWSDSAILDVGPCELLDFGRQQERFDVCLRHSPEYHPDSLGSGFEFPESELGQHEDQRATGKGVQQAAGGVAELVVLAAAQRTEVSV